MFLQHGERMIAVFQCADCRSMAVYDDWTMIIRRGERERSRIAKERPRRETVRYPPPSSPEELRIETPLVASWFHRLWYKQKVFSR